MPTTAPVQQSKPTVTNAGDWRDAAVGRNSDSAATSHLAISDAVYGLGLHANSSILWLGTDAYLDESFPLDTGFDRICVDHDAYDCVVADGVLARARWDRLLVRQLFCLVRPGGYLVATVPIGGQRSRRRRRSLPALRTCTPRSFDHLIRKVGFDIVNSKTISRGPSIHPRAPSTNRFVMAFPSCLLRASLSVALSFVPSRLFPLSRCRADTYLVVAQKPTHAGRAARLDFTPALDKDIDGFEAFYAGELERLSKWEATHGRNLATPSPLEAERGLANAKSALVLSPHPDDELIGCGGSLLQLLDRGARVHVTQMTDGSASQALRDEDEHTRQTIRSEEAKRVAQAMGATELSFLGAPNGRLDASSSYVEPVRRTLAEMRPEVVFVPFVNDKHPDHVAANLILDAAFDGVTSRCTPLVFSYEVWSVVPRHLVHAIDDVVQRKLDLLMLYSTPMRVVDYIWHCQVRDGRHSRRCLGRDGYAESFLVLSGDRYRSMMDSHRRRS